MIFGSSISTDYSEAVFPGYFRFSSTQIYYTTIVNTS